MYLLFNTGNFESSNRKWIISNLNQVIKLHLINKSIFRRAERYFSNCYPFPKRENFEEYRNQQNVIC